MKIKEVFHSRIRSEKKFNSWFSVDFGREVFVAKGAICLVDVSSTNVYAHIRENIEKAQKCAAFSQFEFIFYGKNHISDTDYVYRSSEMDRNYFFSIKSLSVVPIDEQECRILRN